MMSEDGPAIDRLQIGSVRTGGVDGTHSVGPAPLHYQRRETFRRGTETGPYQTFPSETTWKSSLDHGASGARTGVPS